MRGCFIKQCFPAGIVTSVLLVAVAFAQQSDWFRKSTPEGETRDCSVVENETDMIRELRAVGWDTSTIPVVNWKDDCAVIIAPKHSDSGMEMVFLRLVSRGGANSVDWGWQPLRDEETVRNPDGSYSKTSGSRNGGHETIVVTFKHGIHANQFVCTEFPPE